MLFGKTEFRQIPPLAGVVGWKDLPIEECGESLVPLGFFSDYPEILFDPIYYGMSSSSPYAVGQFNGSLITPFVRSGVAERLVRAARTLPSGYMFMIWDAYRPVEVQKALFWWYVDEVLVGEKMMDRDAAIEAAQQFVSFPSDDPTRPAPHNTGGTVDLTLVRFEPENWKRMRHLGRALRSAKRRKDDLDEFEIEMERWAILRGAAHPVDMGTVFDEVRRATALCFFEEESRERNLTFLEQRQLRSRRILYWAVAGVGLSAYPAEWWHFDVGNQFDSVRTGRPAFYGAAEFSNTNEEHEEMMRMVFEGCTSATDGLPHPRQRQNLKIAVEHPLRRFVCDVVARTGDLRVSVHPRVAIL